MGAARLNIPIRRTNHYQEYNMSYHIYCGRIWNLIQTFDVHKNLVYPDQVGPEVIQIDENLDNPEKSKNHMYRLYNRQSYKSVVPDICRHDIAYCNG